MSRQQSRIKETKNTNSKNKIVFCSKYDPMGPNIKNIIPKHAPILNNCQIIQSKEIMVEYKHKKKLKELLTRADLYNISNNLMTKCTHMFHARNDVIHVQTLWSQKVLSNVLLQKEFKNLLGLPHMFPKM